LPLLLAVGVAASVEAAVKMGVAEAVLVTATRVRQTKGLGMGLLGKVSVEAPGGLRAELAVALALLAQTEPQAITLSLVVLVVQQLSFRQLLLRLRQSVRLVVGLFILAAVVGLGQVRLVV
jgi:hypothetical protein